MLDLVGCWTWSGPEGTRLSQVESNHSLFCAIAAHACLNAASVRLDAPAVTWSQYGIETGSKGVLEAVMAVPVPERWTSRHVRTYFERFGEVVHVGVSLNYRRLILALREQTARRQAHMDSLTLLRFVLARPNIDASASMFMNTMRWRAERSLGALYAEMHPTGYGKTMGAGGDSSKRELAAAHFYGGLVGTTREGGPQSFRLAAGACQA